MENTEKKKRILERDTALPPFEDNDPCIVFCGACKSGEYLHNEDGARNVFCGQCGQRINWSALDLLEQRLAGQLEQEE